MNKSGEPIEIRPIGEESIAEILSVYQACEDFLALGPVATASLEMVRSDLEMSKSQGGEFCGIYFEDKPMIGVVDFIRGDYQGRSDAAFISLLMLARSFRKRGIGSRVMDRVEGEIRKTPGVTTIFSGVQVNNPLAIRFWRNRGYAVISGPDLMADQTTVFHLEKKILQGG